MDDDDWKAAFAVTLYMIGMASGYFAAKLCDRYELKYLFIDRNASCFFPLMTILTLTKHHLTFYGTFPELLCQIMVSLHKNGQISAHLAMKAIYLSRSFPRK